MRTLRILILMQLVLSTKGYAGLMRLSACAQNKSEKPRILVSTDIGGTDPDDNQSMIHLMMYSDLFQLEGLVSSPSFGNGSKQELLRMIDLYEQDYPTLLRHCPQLLPPDSLRGMCKQGRHGLMPLKGYDKPTEGSEWIVHCARKPDTRPLWILVWGTLEDVAQALHDAPTYPPERKIGQGFASATGQYLDICIRFDTETLTGYALRIIRTTKYANAVDMQLMRYDHGNTTMIGEPISTTCFISPCTIHVWTKGNQLRAHVETAGKQRKSELADHVDLQTTIQQEPYYGAAFQFTGSAGGSAIMFHYLRMEWGK